MIKEGLRYRKQASDTIIDVSFTKFMQSEQSVLAEISSRFQFDVEIQKVESMKLDVDSVPVAVDTRKIEILKYYDPLTDKWSAASDELFSVKDKEELKKLYNEKVQIESP